MYIPRTGRKWGAGDLVGLLLPSKWTESGKTYFQEPFFSKGICGHRPKGSIREQLSSSTVSPPMKEYTHCERLTLSQPGPVKSAFSMIRIQSDVDMPLWELLSAEYNKGYHNLLERQGKCCHMQTYLLGKPRERKDGQGCNSCALILAFFHYCELFPHQSSHCR